MFDNSESFIKGLYFKPELLAHKFLEIIENIDILNNIFKTLMFDYNKRLSSNVFTKKFIDALQ
jgi:hypothetical protein